MPTLNIEDDNRPAPKSATNTGPVKRGPGRPPGSGSKQVQNVNAALGTMDSLYGLMATGAQLMHRELTANVIANQIDTWQAQNKKAFESSPKLAQTIANIGQTSGFVTFLTTNVVAFGMVALALREENELIRNMKEADNAESSASDMG